MVPAPQSVFFGMLMFSPPTQKFQHPTTTSLKGPYFKVKVKKLFRNI